MSGSGGGPLLELDHLSMSYRSGDAEVRAVDDVSFTLGANDVLGLVGESGCGKTSVGLSIMRLLPTSAAITAGAIRLSGTDIVNLSEEELQPFRWKRVAMVFQAAMNALNPVLRVVDQIVEPMLFHEVVKSRAAAEERAAELFALVGLPPDRLRNFPHEFSGGMRQRAVIAMSLACEPRLLIADEPTTALDVVVQEQIFLRIVEIRERLGLSMVLISHDIGVVAENCRRVAVMYGGKIVETGPVDIVLRRPQHPYTILLLGATPRLSGPASSLASLPGNPPTLSRPPEGCIFVRRCPLATSLCHSTPPPEKQLPGGHTALCHYAGEVDERDVLGRVPLFGASAAAPAAATLVELRGLTKRFELNRGFLAAALGHHRSLTAVNGVDLRIGRGEALGLVGESGCGKTTVGMLLSKLEEPSAGSIRFEGREIGAGHADKSFRRAVQVIFQDPYESLNPRMPIREALEEPLTIHGIGEGTSERRDLVHRMMEKVGLTPVAELAPKYPAQLSGGQRQRVAIARAMIIGPEFIVCDEPLSMLDASVKTGVMSLLKQFKEEGVTLLFITHDLAIARYLCDRIAVMYLGDIVEIGPVEEVIGNPRHPYTRILLASVPDPNRATRRERVIVEGEPPNPIARPGGCPFHPRCPDAIPACRATVPTLRLQSATASVACLLYEGAGTG